MYNVSLLTEVMVKVQAVAIEVDILPTLHAPDLKAANLWMK